MNDDIGNINAEVGRLIRAYRENAGLTQTDLSAATGFSRTKITDIERGWAWSYIGGERKKAPYLPKPEDLAKIAPIIGADTHALFDAAGYDANKHSTLLGLEHADFADLTPHEMRIVRAVLKALREARYDPTTTTDNP